MKKPEFNRSSLIISALFVSILAISLIAYYINDQNIKNELSGSKWEFDYAGIRQGDFDPTFAVSNLTLNNDMTFDWITISDDGETSTFKGTYFVIFSSLELKYSSGSAEEYPFRITDGKLFLDDECYTKVNGGFKKTSVYVKKEDVAATTNSSTANTTTTLIYNCILSGCPNKTTSPGTYCSVHNKGKTNTCLNCGAKIWADETYCDNCLFGDFDFTEYGIDY